MEAIYVADPEKTPLVTEKFSIKEKVLVMRGEAKKIGEFLWRRPRASTLAAQQASLAKWRASLNDDSYGSDERFKIRIDVRELKLKPSMVPHSARPTAVNQALGLHDGKLPINQCVRDIVEHAGVQDSQEDTSRSRSKYMGIRWIEDSDSAAASDEADLTPLHDACVSVRVYRPFKHVLGNGKKPQHPKFGQEIVICVKQTLSELRAAIMCAADMGVAQDMSHNPDAAIHSRAWDIYKSGYFFIDNTFYNDSQSESNVDYSAPERAWAQQNSVGPLRVGSSMEAMRVEDLRVQLGYPYLYKHQGNCEHLLVFADLRLLGGADSLVRANYPYVHTGSLQHSRYCMVCGRFMAKWVVFNSALTPVNPCYECDECFRSLNYIDKNKVGDFQAYPYVDDTSLV